MICQGVNEHWIQTSCRFVIFIFSDAEPESRPWAFVPVPAYNRKIIFLNFVPLTSEFLLHFLGKVGVYQGLLDLIRMFGELTKLEKGYWSDSDVIIWGKNN